MRLITVCNLYYPVTAEAQAYYDSRKDLNLRFYRGGDPSSDRYFSLNHLINEWSVIKTAYDRRIYDEAEYVGFNHYRLFFKELPPNLDGDSYCAKPIPLLIRNPDNGYVPEFCSIEKAYRICHIPGCWDVLEQIMLRKEDARLVSAWKNMQCLTAPCNMFVMRADTFRRYAEWMWDYVEELLVRVDMRNERNAYQHRQIAFLTERLASFWFFKTAVTERLDRQELDTVKFDGFKPISDLQERNTTR